MKEAEIRAQASKLLAELMELDALATSQMQRRHFKDARDYLQRAADMGSDAAWQLGSYHYVVVSSHIHEVQEGLRKGLERKKKRQDINDESL